LLDEEGLFIVEVPYLCDLIEKNAQVVKIVAGKGAAESSVGTLEQLSQEVTKWRPGVILSVR
jgi:hypothetical protein